MADNDYFVVACKILSYLYERMKKGEDPKIEEFSHGSELLDIPERYWTQVMAELIENGYIKGASVVKGRQIGIKCTRDAVITMAGVAFLQDNTKMQQAKDFIKNALPATLAALIGLANT